jgi:hypothetical protein
MASSRAWLRPLPIPPGVVGDVHTLRHRVVDGFDGIRDVAAIGAEELERSDLGIPVNARHTYAVVAGRSDGARDVRAVLVAVAGDGVGIVDGGVVVGEVVAVDVVHVAVAVVVRAVAGDLAGVGPDVVPEVRVVDVHALVDHAYHDVRATGGHIPGLGHVGVSIRGPAGLAGVIEAPQVSVAGIVGSRGRVHLEVRLGVGDAGRLFVGLHGLGDGEVPRQVHDVHVAAGQVLLDPRAVLPVEFAQVGRRCGLLEHDDHLARRERPPGAVLVGRLLPDGLGDGLLRRRLQA